MNNKGFTMIELLAAMVLLSILMLVAVPTVLNLMDQTRRKTVINDAKKFVSSAEYKVKNNNNYIKRPRSTGQCIVLTLGYLDLGNEFQEGPHGGAYLLDDSYVIVKYDPPSLENGNDTHVKKYKYYVTLVEKYHGETYYGLYLYPADKLDNKHSEGFVNGFNTNNLLSKSISAPNNMLKNGRVTNPESASLDTVGELCSGTNFTNPHDDSNLDYSYGRASGNVYDTEDALNELNVKDPHE